MLEHDVDSRRLRLLEAMGIEVWRRRGRSVPTTAAPPEQTVAVPVASPPAPAPAPAVVHAEPVARSPDLVHIELIALSGPAGVVVGPLATSEERRIAQGIFLALGGPGAEPALARFEWPPATSLVSTASATASAADSACRAFLKGQVDRARATCLVLLGDEVADRLPVPDRLSIPVIRGPVARALRGDPQGKRELWRQIAATKRR